ncbi:MAG: hypothetical protein LBG58_09535 [Planctomycetaceae bacterium]|jgi:hypothetical protein|nr:hypothetical protein [Planctomycetaceae bacterium]
MTRKTINMENFDAVKMVREIRNRHYKITKNMTTEEKRNYDRQQIEEYKRYAETLNLDDYDFPFIHKK